MKTIVRKPWIIRIIKIRLRNSDPKKSEQKYKTWQGNDARKTHQENLILNNTYKNNMKNGVMT